MSVVRILITAIIIIGDVVFTSSYSAVTETHIALLKTEIRSLINSTGSGNSGEPLIDQFPTDLRPLIAALVRLIFHDCSAMIQFSNGSFSTETGCDGTIQNNARHAPNGGLTETINLIEPLYQSTFNTIMSRADYWANSAMVAVEYGAELAMEARNALLPSGSTLETDSGFKINNWWYGRIDALDSPYYVDQDFNNDRGVWIDFPHPYFTGDDSISFFNGKYGFTNRETVAIIGAHTLGRNKKNWGHGAWTPDRVGIASRPDTLDNQFFIDMIDGADDGSTCNPIPDTNLNWRIIQLDDNPGRRVYVDDTDYQNLIQDPVGGDDKRSGSKSLMFTSDLALFYNITSIEVPGAKVLTCTAEDPNDADGVLRESDGELPEGHDVQECAVMPFIIDDNECGDSSSSDDSSDDGSGPLAKYVRLYAMDNKVWLNDFAHVFEVISKVSPFNTLSKIQFSESSSSSSED